MRVMGWACIWMAGAAYGALDVASVEAWQRWPWNDQVEVAFSLNGTEAETPYRVELSADVPGRGTVVAGHVLSDPVVKGAGPHRLVWDMGRDLPGFVSTNLHVRVSVTEFQSTTPVFLCVDLATPTPAGSLTPRYSVRYTTVEPDWSNDTCKTSEFWMRRLRAAQFTMGTGSSFYTVSQQRTYLPAHPVLLTNDYYMAVFETTQTQWGVVTGTWPSAFTNAADRATRPVENVTFGRIRGSNKGVLWPDSAEVDEGSFVALFRARSGLTTFDLPTDAQWEFAYRAGTTGTYYTDAYASSRFARWSDNGGKVLDEDGKLVDPPKWVAADDGGTARVGSYEPNPWGLYDMAGNVFEVCLDRHSFERTRAEAGVLEIEPVGEPSSIQPGTNDRVGRGGAATHGRESCSAYFRRAVTSAISICGCRFVVVVKK